jgi:DNA-binding MarR family transcriptional regulator
MPEQTTVETAAEDTLRELPPSAKLVYKVLEYDGSLTQGQLADETLLPPRTVRYATSRLEEAGVVDSRFSFTDARKRLYSITAEPATSGPLSEPL